MSGGPNYESVAELRMFSMLGVMMMMIKKMMIMIMTMMLMKIPGGLCGYELYPRVSHRAPRQHGSPRLLPRHKPGGYCGNKYFFLESTKYTLRSAPWTRTRCRRRTRRCWTPRPPRRGTSGGSWRSSSRCWHHTCYNIYILHTTL